MAAVEPMPADSEVAARIHRGLISSAEIIDLSDAMRTPVEVGRLYAGLLQDDPMLFHVAPRLSYAMSGDYVTTVYPVYALTGAPLVAARALYRETMAGLLAEMDARTSGHPRTDAETALMVHDMLAARYDYDVRALTADDTAGRGEVCADVYRFFRDGVGVCQAYALATIALLRAAGLEADFVSSPTMDHAWVHVRVGAAWYHMDVTRDDPVAILPDGTARSAHQVTHMRVLRSDAGMRALGYDGFSCAGGHTCTEDRYERADARAVLSRLLSPLSAVSAGKGRPLLWVGETTDGELYALSWSDAGLRVHAPDDIDGDGAVTPGDLLLLTGSGVPSAWQEQLRARLVAW